MPPVLGRPAALDFVEVEREGSRVVRVRGALFADTGAPVYVAQRRAIDFALASEARAAYDAEIEHAHGRGLSEVGPSVALAASLYAPPPLDPRHETAASFVERLASVPWFVELGTPTSYDREVTRFWSFDDWPGHEDDSSERLAEQLAQCEAELNEVPTPPDSRSFGERVVAVVTSYASWNVDFDTAQDFWHPPNACVGEASVVSGLIARFLLAGRPLPAPLVDLWAWYARGHWPAGCDAGAGPDEARLLVY